MIQRIQSIWLLLAAIVISLLFLTPIYHLTSGGTQSPLIINDDFVAILIAAASVVLSLLTIFLYKKRKNQISLTYLNILVCLGLEFWIYEMIEHKKTALMTIDAASATGNYWIGAFLPIIAIIFLFLALKGIKKDEKLIKSLDRLR